MPDKVSLWEQLKMLNEWMPLLGFLQRYIAERDTHKRALVAGELMEWLASKTTTKLDDDLVKLVVAAIATAEGEALVRFLVAQAEVMVSSEGAQS